MRYSAAGVLLKAQIKGELRVTMIPVRSLDVSGTKPVVKRVDAVLSLHVYRRGLRSVLLAYRLSLSNTDDDFSKMRAAFLVAVCRRGVGKWKCAINRRLELVPGAVSSLQTCHGCRHKYRG